MSKLLCEDGRIHLNDVQSLCVFFFFKETEKNQIEYFAQSIKVKYLMLHSRWKRILRKIPFLIKFETIPRVLFPVDLNFNY